MKWASEDCTFHRCCLVVPVTWRDPRLARMRRMRRRHLALEMVAAFWSFWTPRCRDEASFEVVHATAHTRTDHVLSAIHIGTDENAMTDANSDSNHKKLTRRGFIKWTTALVATGAAAVGVAAGVGGDILFRPTKTSTTTVTVPVPTLSYTPPCPQKFRPGSTRSCSSRSPCTPGRRLCTQTA